MTSSLPSPKPRAFTKWLDAAASPVAAVDQAGRLQFYNTAFEPFLQSQSPELLLPQLLPPAEAWNGVACQRAIQFAVDDLSSNAPPSQYNFATYVPLMDQDQETFGCLITLMAVATQPCAASQPSKLNTLKPSDVVSLNTAPSDALQHELLEFRKRWSDATHLDVLCGNSPQIRKTLQQVQVAIATHTPVLIRGYDLHTCHDLAKGIWLQRFKKSHISSAGFQFMPIAARALDGEMLRSALDLALPMRLHGEYLETCLLIEDISALHAGGLTILSDWLSHHRPPQIFATELLTPDQKNETIQQRGLEPYFGVLVIDIPSLQNRPEDIPAIATRILNHSPATTRGTSYAFAPSAMEALIAYPWHGDLHELKTLLNCIALPSHKFVVEISDLPLVLRSYIGGKASPTHQNTSIDLDQTLLELEKSLLEKTLVESRGNRALTARKLGISRARLLRRLAQLNIIASESDPSSDSDSEAILPDNTKQPLPKEPANTTDDVMTIDFVPVDDDTRR